MSKTGWVNSRAYRAKSSDPERNSADWSEEELADLAKAFLRGESIESLAIKHKRKRNAIECRIGRIADKIALN